MSIKDAVESYLSYKNSLGYKYNNVSFMLKMFVSFVGQDRNLGDITADDGYRSCSIRTLSERLRSQGFETQKTKNGLIIYAERNAANISTENEENPVF